MIEQQKTRQLRTGGHKNICNYNMINANKNTHASQVFAAPGLRKRPHADPEQAYEREKKAWDQAHPDVDGRTRDLALREIARRLGV